VLGDACSTNVEIKMFTKFYLDAVKGIYHSKEQAYRSG
jgi:hypothetical protein